MSHSYRNFLEGLIFDLRRNELDLDVLNGRKRDHEKWIHNHGGFTAEMSYAIVLDDIGLLQRKISLLKRHIKEVEEEIAEQEGE